MSPSRRYPAEAMSPADEDDDCAWTRRKPVPASSKMQSGMRNEVGKCDCLLKELNAGTKGPKSIRQRLFNGQVDGGGVL